MAPDAADHQPFAGPPAFAKRIGFRGLIEQLRGQLGTVAWQPDQAKAVGVRGNELPDPNGAVDRMSIRRNRT